MIARHEQIPLLVPALDALGRHGRSRDEKDRDGRRSQPRLNAEQVFRTRIHIITAPPQAMASSQ